MVVYLASILLWAAAIDMSVETYPRTSLDLSHKLDLSLSICTAESDEAS